MELWNIKWLILILFLAHNTPTCLNAVQYPSLKQILVDGISDFSTNLGNLLFQNSLPDKNVFFSPLSLYTSLCLLHLGAKNNTKDELKKVLSFPSHDVTTENIDSIVGNISKVLQNSEAFINVSAANGLFIRLGANLSEDYHSKALTDYESEIKTLDFTNAASTDTINQWISNRTKNHIPKIFTSPLEKDTELVLANVLHFEAQWMDPFDRKYTKKTNFTISSEQVIEVNMMYHKASVPYWNNINGSYEVLGLPYKNNEFTMYFILPHGNNNATFLSSKLAGTDLRMIVNTTTQSRLVRYYVPQIKTDWKKDLNDEFKLLGLKSVFERPDFSNMVSDSIKVSKINHASNLIIDESGTSASAVTAISFQVRSGYSGGVLNFHLDKPFLLFLYHHETESILFYGLIRNPNGN